MDIVGQTKDGKYLLVNDGSGVYQFFAAQTVADTPLNITMRDAEALFYTLTSKGPAYDAVAAEFDQAEV